MDVEWFSLWRPADWPPSLRWAALLALSLIFGAALAAMQLPAAPLLGPMVAGVLLAANGGAVQTPRPAFFLAQGVVGVMIASFLPRSIFAEIGADWPIFLIGVLSTIAAASLLGWLLTRSRVLPGTTAIWGSSPGAATAMTLMSEHYGADLRLVAFMQYTRVACCALVAAIVARLFGTPAVQATMASQAWSTQSAVAALAIALLGSFLGVQAAHSGRPIAAADGDQRRRRHDRACFAGVADAGSRPRLRRPRLGHRHAFHARRVAARGARRPARARLHSRLDRHLRRVRRRARRRWRASIR